MNVRQRIRALHTVAAFMAGAPACSDNSVQRLTVLSYTPTSRLYQYIYDKQRGYI